MVTAVGAASVTTDLRIGVELSLGGPSETLRLAEDLAVLDQCSSGRAELRLTIGDTRSELWDAAHVLMRQLHQAKVAGAPDIQVTPGLAQPVLPVFVTCGSQEFPSATLISELESATDSSAERHSGHRRAILIGGSHTAQLLAAADDAARLKDTVSSVRQAVGAVEARDAIFVLESATDVNLHLLGAVVAPILRANDSEVEDLITDIVHFNTAMNAYKLTTWA
jgi:hypothetical protein